jgi:AraC-like DNA-binding protein
MDNSAQHPALEKHYSIEEVRALWGLSDKTVKKLFREEKGVLRFGRPGSSTRRAHETLRIPESVLLRVHSRLR